MFLHGDGFHNSHFGSSHFVQTSGCLHAWRVLLFHFCTPLRRRLMPRRGCSRVVAGDPWASTSRCAVAQGVSRSWSGPKATISEQEREQEADREGKFWVENRRGPPQVSPAAQDRVLQTAVNALGDDDSPEAKMLRDALKKAQQEVTTAPVGVRLDACAQFMERAKNRLLKADEALRKAQRCKLEQELKGGRAEVGGASSRGFRAGARTTSSRGRSFESEEVGVRIAGPSGCLRGEQTRQWEGVEELRRLRREVEDFRRSWNEAKTSEFVNRIGNSKINESFCPYGISDRCKRPQAQMCGIHGSLMVWADRSCRYGLCGIGVGEASNPGPSSNECGRLTTLSEEAAAPDSGFSECHTVGVSSARERH